MGNKQRNITLNTIEECNAYFGIEMQHPLVSIVDLAHVKRIDVDHVQLDLYAVACAIIQDKEDGNVGVVNFFSPGHASHSYNYNLHHVGGWILFFHPDLIIDTLLQQRMSEYSFFDQKNSLTLKLTEQELHSATNCMLSIRQEVKSENDRYSRRILVAGIAVLLSVCMRYAERHHDCNAISNNNVVARLNTYLNYYVAIQADGKAYPSVAECARELNISPNYLGDLVHKQAGCSAHSFIQRFIVNEAKTQLLRTSQTINQIAYNLGFKYPHHLTRTFKQYTGMTPKEYRATNKPHYIHIVSK